MSTKIPRDALKKIASMCGLSVGSVRDLLMAGWTFNSNYKGEISWTKE